MKKVIDRDEIFKLFSVSTIEELEEALDKNAPSNNEYYLINLFNQQKKEIEINHSLIEKAINVISFKIIFFYDKKCVLEYTNTNNNSLELLI
jgi:hypothetical protein